MTDIAIRVENLSKLYFIGAIQKDRNLREAIKDTFIAPFRRAERLLRGHATGAAELDETIWALKDVSFEVKSGEVVGVIGGNGAGKSTLLKIISRIVEPTEGFAEIRGRMGSLLEVGTGFHAELTGRENIYLNGAILGMKKTEIRQKYNEIVSFSGVEKFIDTPVKHYSSGMYLRLAFAVAAHLEPEILIVDEVLAVGDAEFQKKCLNKMEDVGKEGRTVLFVSHNMQAINRLCSRAILLREGKTILDGPAHQVVGFYLTEGKQSTAVREWADVMEAPGEEVARLLAVRVKTEEDQITAIVDIRKPVIIEMEYEILRSGFAMMPHFELFNEQGASIFISLDQDPLWRRRPRPSGRYVSTAIIPGNLLSEGVVFVAPGNATLNPMNGEYFVRDAVSFQVVDTHEGNSARGDWVGNLDGVVRPILNWNTQYMPHL